ncbi:protein kinase domain-containing protein [Streptomyces sp. NPDC055287]
MPSDVYIAACVADALEAAHDKGLTHRDIKASNIMVLPGGGAKVVDFGITIAVYASRIPGGDQPQGLGVDGLSTSAAADLPALAPPTNCHHTRNGKGPGSPLGAAAASANRSSHD